MLTEIFGSLLAGLGLFFIGVKLIGEHTKQMTGRRFRMMVSRLTEHSALAGIWGMISGALMQSTSAVTFIVISLISAGLITVRRAMPIVAWANVGNSALVALAVLDLHLAALYLLGITGFLYYLNLDRSVRFRHWVGALLGIGLLFLGLIEMKDGAAPLKSIGWFTQFLAYTNRSYLLAFLIGAFLTFIAQSASTVSVVAIALAKAGLLGWEQTAMIVYGANLGTGLSTTFMASNVRGTAKQLGIFQCLFKCAGTIIFVPLFYLETSGGVPLVRALVSRFSPDIGHQMAHVFLIFQLATAFVISFVLTPIQKLLERISPPTEEEVLAKPQFIYDQAIEEPETALELVAQEQFRLAQRLPQYLDSAREDTETEAPPLEALHAATVSILKQIDSFATDLLDQNHSRGALERIIRAQTRSGVFHSLDESLFSLAELAGQASNSPTLGGLSARLIEGLHTVLVTAVEALESPTAANREILLRLTSDRGDLIERIRRAVLRAEPTLGAEEQKTLFAITSLFERIVWLLRQLGSTLEEETKEEAAKA